jgi:hypothetical protein
MADDDPPNIAKGARTLIRYVLTLGAALAYAFLVTKTCHEIWHAKTGKPPDIDPVFGGVMNSLAVIFGSAFVGWFGISANDAKVTIKAAGAEGERDFAKNHVSTTRWWRAFWAMTHQLAGAAVASMVIYLAFGALAGVTYVFYRHQTPVLVITVATAWATQASAVVASTLSAMLKADDGSDPPGGGGGGGAAAEVPAAQGAQPRPADPAV